MARALGQFEQTVLEVGSVDEIVAALSGGGVEAAVVNASAAANEPDRLATAARASGARLIIVAGSDEAVAISEAARQVVILRKPISGEMLGRALAGGIGTEPLAEVA